MKVKGHHITLFNPDPIPLFQSSSVNPLEEMGLNGSPCRDFPSHTASMVLSALVLIVCTALAQPPVVDSKATHRVCDSGLTQQLAEQIGDIREPRL